MRNFNTQSLLYLRFIQNRKKRSCHLTWELIWVARLYLEFLTLPGHKFKHCNPNYWLNFVFVGTLVWYLFLVNSIKITLSASLLISSSSNRYKSVITFFMGFVYCPGHLHDIVLPLFSPCLLQNIFPLFHWWIFFLRSQKNQFVWTSWNLIIIILLFIDVQFQIIHRIYCW